MADERKKLVMTIEVELGYDESLGDTFRARVTSPGGGDEFSFSEFFEGQMGPCMSPGSALKRLARLVDIELAKTGWYALAEGYDLCASDDPGGEDSGFVDPGEDEENDDADDRAAI